MAKFTSKKKKQLRRIRRFISSAEKRGFTFPEEIKRNLTTYTTQKLKSFTPSKLYKQASYQVKDLAGNIIDTLTGEQGRRIERTLSAKKAVKTKQYKKWQKKVEANISLADYQYDDDYYDENYIPKFTDIVLSQIEDMISQAREHKWDRIKRNGDILDRYLQDELSAYGHDKVALACEEASDQTKAEAREAINASTDDACHSHSLAMVMIIRGNIPTIDESKQFTEEFDKRDANYAQNKI